MMPSKGWFPVSVAKHGPIYGQPAAGYYNHWKGEKAIIVGNGPSRRDLDLHAIQEDGWKLFCCNWFYREEGQPTADFIGSSDPKPTYDMLSEAVWRDSILILRGVNARHYEAQLRQGYKPVRASDLKDRVIQWDVPMVTFSGPLMLASAVHFGFRPIILVGFDGGREHISGKVQPRGPYRHTHQMIADIFRRAPHEDIYRRGGDWLDFLPEYPETLPVRRPCVGSERVPDLG